MRLLRSFRQHAPFFDLDNPNRLTDTLQGALFDCDRTFVEWVDGVIERKACGTVYDQQYRKYLEGMCRFFRPVPESDQRLDPHLSVVSFMGEVASPQGCNTAVVWNETDSSRTTVLICHCDFNVLGPGCDRNFSTNLTDEEKRFPIQVGRGFDNTIVGHAF